MQFQNPWGALAFALLIPLLLLYLLRQRYKEQTVPSVLLWDAALTQWEAAHPWQRWRKNLLFFLQAAVICLLALALMRPIRPIAGLGRDKVLLIDASLSMQAKEEGNQSRLDRAKDAARALVEGMRPGEEISLMLAGQENRWLAHKNTDKDELLRLIDGIAPEYGGSRPEEALKLAEALYARAGASGEAPDGSGAQAQTDQRQIAENAPALHIFTDQNLGVTDGATLHNLAKNAANAAVVQLNYAWDQRLERLTALGIIQNNGPETALTAELWGDGALLDVQELTLPENAAASVLFKGIDGGVRQLTLSLGESDALEADNHAHCALQRAVNSRVLLRSHRNIFLEKALLLRPNLELYKSSPQDDAEENVDAEDFQLLILDGAGNATDAATTVESADEAGSRVERGQALKDTLPPNLWTFAPKSNGDWYTVAAAESATLRPADSPLARALFQHVDWESMRLAEAVSLKPTDPAADILLYMGDAPLVIAREVEGRRELVFGFDLHQSNLPLEKDFPILVQNVVNWFLPSASGAESQLTVGQAASIPLSADARQYDITLPDGRTLTDQTQRQFGDTTLPGFYSLRQYDGTGQLLQQDAFAVNAAAGSESELRTASAERREEAAAMDGGLRSQALLPLFILAAMAALLLEWWVYHRT